MQITEVRVTLPERPDARLVGFASITLDQSFVIHDIRIIRRPDGSLFVAMPSRQTTERCQRCSGKVTLTARFCSDCGIRLPETGASRDAVLHADVAHPLSKEARAWMERAIIQALEDNAGRRPPALRPLNASPRWG